MCSSLLCCYFAVPACSAVNLLTSNDRRIQEEKRNLGSLCFVLVLVWALTFTHSLVPLGHRHRQ
jgi:hypothetical protein